MERSPFNNSAEQNDEQDDSSAGVSKKRSRRLGSLFARSEEQPAAEQSEAPRPQSLWQRFVNRLQSETPQTPEVSDASEPETELAPEEFAELPTEDVASERLPAGELAEDEAPAVLSALAEARLEALGEPSEDDPAVEHTVADFLQEVAVTGNLDEAEARIMPEVAELHDEPPGPAALQPEVPSPPHIWETAAAPVEGFAAMPQPERPSPVTANLPSRPAPPEKVVIKDREYDYISPAVAGTVAGYLLGRRRGRLKTQKRLETAQKRLEKRVHNLEEQLQVRETHIRRVAAERVRPAPLNSERPRLKPEQFIRLTAPEAHQLHGSKAPERIGKVVVQGPRAEVAAPRASRPGPAETAPRSAVKEAAAQIETLNRAELLTLAGSIYIDGANLRQVYETHLIGERGLRRLAAEHLRGGDMKRALQREITEHQIDFERDPHLRDRAPSAVSGRSASTAAASDASPAQPAAATLSALLEQAGAGMDDRVRSEAAMLRARAAHEAHQAARRSRDRRIVDTSLAGVILLLVAIIALLIITR